MKTIIAFDRGLWLSAIALALIAMAVVAALGLTGWLPAVERSTGDLLLRTPSLRSRPEPPIVAILIDDSAVAQRGVLPWPRERLARLVATVDDLGARAVIFDLILSEPAEATGDLAFADALAEIPHVLGAALSDGGRWLLPLDIFGGADAASHVYGEVGPDGVVRTIAATKQADGLSLPALSLAAARLLRPQIPVPAGVELRPEFQPPPQDIPTFSASPVLDRELPEDIVRDRIVFVGVSATGAGDQFVVPTGPRHAPVPGVLAHASAAASILSGRLIRRPGTVWTAIAAFVLALAVQWLRSRRGSFDLGRFVILVTGLGIIAAVALQVALVLIPLATLLAVVVVSALLREAVESRAARLESGRLLQSLLEHIGVRSANRVPQTASRRLEALQHLQEGVLREDATRRALLAGMEEGVALWGADGELLEVNPAAEKLWGELPRLREIEAVRDESTGEGAVKRAGRELSLHTSPLEGGLLAIIRDVTAESELDRRRRDMQRLVSHELRTPLASISGFGETLERYELTGQEQRRVASLIRGEAGRLQEMVTVFLDLERLGAGHWEGDTEIVDFSELVRRRLEILAAAADARGQSFAPSLADGCLVRGVQALLDRVVDNLLGNAIKYSVDGDSIEVVVRADNDRIVFSVSDHGPGIPADEIPRLSERFYRIAGATESGSGLGLALVDEIATWHGGCIYIESEIGSGSTFTVELPTAGED
jgi:signal transduction histidine kinase